MLPKRMQIQIDTDTLAVETEHDQALDGNGETFTTLVR